jgi:hypothetical protein
LQEEIGAVFHQLEVTASRAARTSASQVNVVPPPVPVRRVAAAAAHHHHHAPLPANKAGIHYNQRRRAGLRVSEDYYIGDLVTQGLSRQSRANNHWNRKQQQQQHPLLVGGRNRWDAAEFQRRISCPGFQHLGNQRSSAANNEFAFLLDQQQQKIDAVGLMPTATASLDVADGTDVQRKKKKQQQPNPRRTLRRYLTADSALQLTDNGRVARQQQPQQHHQSPYNPQAIQVWTTSLMAEFNHIIDGELQRLAMASDPCVDSSSSPATGKFSHAKRANTSCSTSVETGGSAVELSPWARMQLALIDPAVVSASLNGLSVPPPPTTRPPTPPAAPKSDVAVLQSSIQQLSADIDQVERQIFDDLDDLTLTLNNSQSPELLASCSSSSGDCDHDEDNEDNCAKGKQRVEAPTSFSSTTATDESSHISSPLLVSFELFLLLVSREICRRWNPV